jgi:phosphatidylglycerophosphate synthase
MVTTSPDSNRRPLKTRQWSVFQKLAYRLSQMGVTPNAISVSSMAFAMGAGAAAAATGWSDPGISQRGLWIAAAALIQLRLIANLLDGMVAIEGGRKSAVGELYNEVPDRVSDPLIVIGVGSAAGGHVVIGMAAALVAMFVAYIRAIGASVGVGQVFLGPMAKPQRMAVLTAVCLYCGLAPIHWQPTLSDGSGVPALALMVIIAGGLLTAMRRLRRIATGMKQGADQCNC